MKRINKIFSLFIGLMILMVSCDSIVDEKVLENSTTVEEVELVATQNAAKGNLIVLSMNTPGVTGYWNYNLGKALTNKVEIVYPIPGTSTFTYVGTLGAEFFEKTIDVQIDVLDTPLDQDWYDLVSKETAGGKTWVFDKTDLWWFMSDPGNPWGMWWNAGNDAPPTDADGKMTFDLNGDANFTYYSSSDATPVAGTFILDVANKTLQLIGANILGAEEPRGNPNGLYNIVSLTEDELVLFVSNNAGGTGWTWVFRPEE